ncbi:unnamed protein product (mitochondrion) [Plasmodiophora brassicae]|uniref:Major facilitator superfamily (MFS) profile domain-containing protein n=1 Tax=Plasmodiophora brassicae TaxID=37360 RepID=A0A0G4ILZ7_PLABS|nr:hypothetical protein PBRA_004807 [Plasmodiophora brassicae]SPQ93340.1 unnamed protein product [Plasmodiophora brassicae]
MAVKNMCKWRVPLVALSWVQIAASGGAIFGIASLRAILQDMAEFSSMDLVGLGTVGVTAGTLSQFVMGIALDRFGPRLTSFMSLLTAALGMFFLSLSTSATLCVYPAVVLIGLGGPGAQVSVIHLSALFPGHSALIVSLQCAAFQVSFLVFLVFKHVIGTGVPLSAVAGVFGAFLVILAMSSLLVWPAVSLNQPGAQGSVKSESTAMRFRIGSGTKAFSGRGTLLSQLYTSSFAALCVFLPVLVFFLNSYPVIMKEQVMYALGPMQDVSSVDRALDVGQLILSLGLFANPIFGMIADRYGVVVAATVSQVLCIAFSGLILMSPLNPALLPAAFALYTVARNCSFSLFFFVIGFDFGFKFFGTIGGILFLIASAVFSAHGVLFDAFGRRMQAWNTMQLAVMVSLLGFPLYWAQRRAQQARQRKVISCSDV